MRRLERSRNGLERTALVHDLMNIAGSNFHAIFVFTMIAFVLHVVFVVVVLLLMLFIYKCNKLLK